MSEQPKNLLVDLLKDALALGEEYLDHPYPERSYSSYDDELNERANVANIEQWEAWEDGYTERLRTFLEVVSGL